MSGGLGKTTKAVNQFNRPPGRDLNPNLPKQFSSTSKTNYRWANIPSVRFENEAEGTEFKRGHVIRKLLTLGVGVCLSHAPSEINRVRDLSGLFM
jgi:hypothetical protein